MYALTRHLSDRREHELHWQVVDVDEPLMAWLAAPILYISTDEALRLDTEQLDRLKRYLDLGGLIIANPEDDSQALKESILALGKRWYPGRSFHALASDHPVHRLMVRADTVKLKGLSNGVRDVILLADRDMNLPAAPDAYQTQPHGRDLAGLWYNLYAWTSERGELRSRLYLPVQVRTERQPRATIQVVRTRHRGAGMPSPWPGASLPIVCSTASTSI